MTVPGSFNGASSIFHIGPSFHPHETEIGYNIIDAAEAQRKSAPGVFKHFVYSSVLNTQLRKMMNHDCKRFVEEYLMESGLSYTILQPTSFMDNFPVQMLANQDRPIYPALWDPSVECSLVAVRDLAEAGAKVLEEREKHYYAQYPLCSTGPVSSTDVAEKVGRTLGREISIEQADFPNAVKTFLKIQFGDREVDPRSHDVAERMILFYNRRGLKGSPHVLELLLGRKPTTIEQWVRIEMGADQGHWSFRA